MRNQLKLALLKPCWRKPGEEGFSLMELTVVVAVLSTLSALALPVYDCFQRRAKSVAAQQAIIGIKSECQRNYASGISATFTSSALKNYEIRSSGGNSCSDGVISAVPDDIALYPTYFYTFDSGELSYEFRGKKGTSFVECDQMICNKITQDEKVAVAKIKEEAQSVLAASKNQDCKTVLTGGSKLTGGTSITGCKPLGEGSTLGKGSVLGEGSVIAGKTIQFLASTSEIAQSFKTPVKSPTKCNGEADYDSGLSLTHCKCKSDGANAYRYVALTEEMDGKQSVFNMNPQLGGAEPTRVVLLCGNTKNNEVVDQFSSPYDVGTNNRKNFSDSINRGERPSFGTHAAREDWLENGGKYGITYGFD